MDVSKEAEIVRRTKSAALETRIAILDAAERVFFAQGVGQTSLTQIAADANVTRGAIYWHFTGKLALVRAMQERAYQPQQEFIEARDLVNDPNPLGALHQVTVESIARFAADERAKRVYTIMTMRCELVGEMEEAVLCYRDAEDRMRATIAAVFEQARRHGDLDPNWTPETALEACVCVFNGLFNNWLLSREGFDLVAVGSLVVDALFDRFRASAKREDAPLRSVSLQAAG